MLRGGQNCARLSTFETRRPRAFGRVRTVTLDSRHLAGQVATAGGRTRVVLDEVHFGAEESSVGIRSGVRETANDEVNKSESQEDLQRMAVTLARSGVVALHLACARRRWA